MSPRKTPIIVTAYRGVEYQEALHAIERQQYLRDERRCFADGIQAKAVFGSGVYLVSNQQVAAEYAYCHAESSWDRASILEQRLVLQRPKVLDVRYGENELRDEAIYWKYTKEEMDTVASILQPQDWVRWTGEQIREYLIERGYDSILFHLRSDLLYYVSYEPANQISDIRLLHTFDISRAIGHAPCDE